LPGNSRFDSFGAGDLVFHNTSSVTKVGLFRGRPDRYPEGARPEGSVCSTSPTSRSLRYSSAQVRRWRKFPAILSSCVRWSRSRHGCHFSGMEGSKKPGNGIAAGTRGCSATFANSKIAGISIMVLTYVAPFFVDFQRFPGPRGLSIVPLAVLSGPFGGRCWFMRAGVLVAA